MKNTKLQIFEKLAASAPLSILMTYERMIRNACRHRGLEEGLDCWDVMPTALRLARDVAGSVCDCATDIISLSNCQELPISLEGGGAN